MTWGRTEAMKIYVALVEKSVCMSVLERPVDSLL